MSNLSLAFEFFLKITLYPDSFLIETGECFEVAGGDGDLGLLLYHFVNLN